jgi:uncharacterized OB-fold protein
MSFQPLPELNADNEGFWRGGADGSLNIYRCRNCRTWFHPPAPVCPDCLTTDVGPEATSGLATVAGYSVNYQRWAPDMEVPYVVAVVAVDDAPGVQLTTRIIDIAPEDVETGMAVEVSFLNVEDIWLPLFRPIAVSSNAQVTL